MRERREGFDYGIPGIGPQIQILGPRPGTVNVTL